VFQFEGKKRIAAEEAMRHPYFHCLGERTITLPDSEFTYTQTHTRAYLLPQRFMMVPDNRCMRDHTPHTDRNIKVSDRSLTHTHTHLSSKDI